MNETAPPIVYRFVEGAGPAGPGELRFPPEDAAQGTPLQRARDVVLQGLACFERGAGTPTALVLPADTTRPTLDDMLAACLARQLLLRGRLPEGAARLADYAALAREGLRVQAGPPERSLAGVFLAVRNAGGLHARKLDSADLAERFVEGWLRLERVILEAARQGNDPFSEGICDGPEFLRERIYLAGDREVFEQDVRRGMRWSVRLADRVPGLVLLEPKSLLFKHWSRQLRDPFLFLAVRWEPGYWVFSTDPLQRLSLLPLAQRLQAAEAAHDPAMAAADPWFDGGRFQHTLIAAPRGGSRLSEDALLGVVRQVLAVEEGSETRLPLLAALLRSWPFEAYSQAELLGRGGQAPVLRAQGPQGDVAIKLFGLLETSLEMRARNQRERRTIAELTQRIAASDDPRCARLVPVQAVLEADWRGQPLVGLVSHFFAAGSLEAWRRAQEQVEKGSLHSLLDDLCGALSLLHSWGFVHRDVKPANILLELEAGRLRAQLADFGCTLLDGQHTRFADINFSPPLLHEASAAFDVFSVAVVAAFLVRGNLEPPFRNNFNGTLSAAVLEPARNAGSVRGGDDAWYEGLVGLLLEATQFDPRRRPTAEVFGQRLRELA